MPYNQLYSYTT